MIRSIFNLPNYFITLYHNYGVYNQPQSIDLVKDFDLYSLSKHQSEVSKKVQALFNKSVQREDRTFVTFASLLEHDDYEREDEKLFERLGFKQLNTNPEVGIVLEHPSLPGWLIKKNYSQSLNENKELKRSFKCIPLHNFQEFPVWMLPSKEFGKKELAKAQDPVCGVPADLINPLRVVMLKRGQEWIDRLNLDKLKVAEEYLCLLPNCAVAKDDKPLNKKVVVISKKEEILDNPSNLSRLVELAKKNPKELETIFQQLADFIKYNPLTDLHLFNLPFLKKASNTIFLMDGEPIGTIADAADKDMVKYIQGFDPGFFPIAALKMLKAKIPEQLTDVPFSKREIKAIQDIVDPIIDACIQKIILERRWTWRWIQFHCKEALLAFTISSAILLVCQAAIRIFQIMFVRRSNQGHQNIFRV